MASLRWKPALPGVRYLFFDVFGTVVDWRRGTARQLFEQCQLTIAKGAEESGVTRAYAWYKAKSMGLNEWQDFTNKWLEGHSDMVWSIATAHIEGREPPAYKTIDEYQVESFPLLIQKWELHGLWDEATTLRMSMALHRLPPWLDSPEGIKALSAAGFQTIPLSNGNVKLTENLAKYAGLQWSQLSSAELSQSYKPDPKVYLDAAERVGAKPGECALVAAHLYDLEAAVLCGWKSIYVERTGEEKWKSQRIEEAKQWVDVWVTKDEDGLLAAAQELGKAGGS